MINKLIDIDLDNASANGIAQSQTPSTSFTLNGSLGTTLDYARIILFTSAGNESGKNITVNGTDADGNTITETITGPNTTAVTTKYFKTITSITVSSAFGGACTVGTRGTTLSAVSKTIPVDSKDQFAPVIAVDVTGTINYTVQETFNNILKDGTSSATFTSVTALTSQTTDLSTHLTRGATGVRIIINSYSSGAELQMRINSSKERFRYSNPADISSALSGMLDAKASPVATDLIIIQDSEDGNTLKTIEQSQVSPAGILTDSDIGVTVQEEISGASLTSATVATDDKVLIQDTSNSNNLKTVTAQSIADLASGGAIVKLSAKTISAASEVTFEAADGLDASIYDYFILRFRRVDISSNGSVLFNFGTGTGPVVYTGTITGGNYGMGTSGTVSNTAKASNANLYITNDTSTNTRLVAAASLNLTGELSINAETSWPICQGKCSYQSVGVGFVNANFFGYPTSYGSLTGIKITPSTGNLSGEFELYGVT